MLLILSCILFVQAYLFTNLVPALSASGIILFLVYIKMNLRDTIRDLDIEIKRNILEKILFADKPFNVVLKIKNGSNIMHLEISDRIPKGCSVFKGASKYSDLVEPGKEFKLKYSVQANERGHYSFDGVRITLKDKSKLFRYSLERPLVSDIRVHSGTDTIKKAKAVAERGKFKKEAKARKSAVNVWSHEFENIREYLPGDRLKDIEWKSTSRLSKLMTKVYENETSVPSIILLDCSKSMRKTKGDRSKIDHGISLSLQLTKMLSSWDHPVGLLAFDEHRVLTDITPSSSREQFDRIFNALLYIPNQIKVDEYKMNMQKEPLPSKSDSETRFIQTIAPFLTGKRRRYTSSIQATGIYEAIRILISKTQRNQLLLLISDLETNLNSQNEALRLAKKQGHKVVLITPFTYWYDSETHYLEPELLENIYESYSEKQKIIGKLRGLGVKVIEISPKDQGLRVIKELRRQPG